jgi:hypothetical protein
MRLPPDACAKLHRRRKGELGMDKSFIFYAVLIKVDDYVTSEKISI